MVKAKDRPYDAVSNIIAFECGELDAKGTLELFAYLVRTRMAWGLQGSYGRTAQALIDNGYISQDGLILKYPDEE